MPISRGAPWGRHGALPPEGVVVRSDAEARRHLEEARRAERPPPVLGLLGGDLCRTLGGDGDERRVRSEEAMTLPVDLGEVLLDGRLHLFVAHLVARTRTWGVVFVAMNAQWRGAWNLGPRAHPNDGLLDLYDATLSVGDRLRARSRLRRGTHVPHPAIGERRTAATQETFARPLQVWLDGEPVGRHRTLSVRVEPDALTVVV